jgi:Beta-lactamase enzyme family
VRRTAATLLLAAALICPTSAAAERWQPDVKSAARWAAERQGVVSFAVRTNRGVEGRGLDRQYPSASVIKAMMLATYLRQPSVRNRALAAGDRALLGPMIRWSDNDAATAVRNIVGNDAITRLATAAGMTRFYNNPVWGFSLITAHDQTRFFLRIDRLIPRRHRAYAMELLETIVTEQRWGLARAVPRGWTLYFKGGWHQEPRIVEHQVGLLRRGRHRVSLAVLTSDSPSNAYGRETEEGVAKRLARGLGPQVRGRVEGAPWGALGSMLKTLVGYSLGGGSTAGWSSAPPSSAPSSGASSLLRPPTPTGAGFFSGFTTLSLSSSSLPSSAFSTSTVAWGSSSARSTKSASGSSM